MLTGGLVYRATREPDRFEKMMEQFSAYTDLACACRTSECIQTVTDAMSKWSAELAKDYDATSFKPDESETKRATQVAERLTTCIMKASTSH